jgi:hypothetical protein
VPLGALRCGLSLAASNSHRQRTFRRAAFVSLALSRVDSEYPSAIRTCLDIWVHLLVQPHVAIACQYLKILQTIVERVSVLVVNMLV